MKLRALAIVGVLLCWVSATPAAGSEGTNNNGAAADETALMNLYFGKEQLVEVATSYPKPISQVAEDVTVVTAEEIEAMHAHSVAEVLERVPGVFVTFHGRGEPGIGSGLSIQDSDYEHVLVLVDGIRWNSVADDFPETNDIPVNIIDRIEVIKGAASSTWGSALGGVVNIITKKTGTDARPHGFAQVGIGEHGTRSYQGEVAGGLSDFGYYLYAGREEADGILNNRFFDSKNLFGKFSYELSRTHFSGEIGFSQPENRYTYVLRPDLGSWADFTDISEGRALFYSVDMANDLTDSLHFYLQYYGRENDYTTSDLAASTGDLFTKTTAEGDQRGVNSRLALERGRQTIVLGAEYLERDNTDHDDLTGYTAGKNREEIYAFYLNDTIRLGDSTLTPGLRYDHLAIADDQVSPSLGFTYRLSEATLLRAAVSRGFRKPTVGLKDGDVNFHLVNPELESETIWTYQTGIETTAVPYLWLKATGFRHDSDHVWVEDPNTWAWVNDGEAKRTGVEVAFRTMPVYHLSLGANYTFVHLDPAQGESDDQYEFNLLLQYSNTGWQAQLYGHYIWWSDIASPPDYNGVFNQMLWDFILSKSLTMHEHLQAELFLDVHNLFNGSQYIDELEPNAPRWLEAGLRLNF